MDDKQVMAAAASAPTRPFHLNGRVYALRPPTLAALASIASEAARRANRETPLAALVNDPAFKLLPVAAQVEAAKIATTAQVSGSRPLDGLALAEGLFQPDVLAFAIWCCARAQHEGLTLEEIRKEINEDNASAVFVDFNEASGMLAMQEKNSAGPSPWDGTGGPSSSS